MFEKYLVWIVEGEWAVSIRFNTQTVRSTHQVRSELKLIFLKQQLSRDLLNCGVEIMLDLDLLLFNIFIINPCRRSKTNSQSEARNFLRSTYERTQKLQYPKSRDPEGSVLISTGHTVDFEIKRSIVSNKNVPSSDNLNSSLLILISISLEPF